MTPTDLAPALLALGRTEGSAHGFREAAKNLRAMADQLDAAAQQADQQAATQKKATDALIAGAKTRHTRVRAAVAAALGAWKAGGR